MWTLTNVCHWIVFHDSFNCLLTDGEDDDYLRDCLYLLLATLQCPHRRWRSISRHLLLPLHQLRLVCLSLLGHESRMLQPLHLHLDESSIPIRIPLCLCKDDALLFLLFKVIEWKRNSSARLHSSSNHHAFSATATPHGWWKQSIYATTTTAFFGHFQPRRSACSQSFSAPLNEEKRPNKWKPDNEFHNFIYSIKWQCDSHWKQCDWKECHEVVSFEQLINWKEEDDKGCCWARFSISSVWSRSQRWSFE